MKQVINDGGRPIKIWTNEVEEGALSQLKNLARLPFIHKHVAVMPDVHGGKGSTIGTVIATDGAIIPAAVGVDIGCGMCAVRLPFQVDQIKDLKALRSEIEAVVPVGFNKNKEVTNRVGDKIKEMGDPSFENGMVVAAFQLGTLGGGNHFIEVCTDLDGGAWVMLHSGSRNIGKRLADIHINKAKGLMKKYFISLPDPDLAYLAQGTKEFGAYLSDLHWAQNYAKENRNEMMERILEVIFRHQKIESGTPQDLVQFRVDCHHNYTRMENHFGKNIWVTRKGAVSAKDGEYGIIPGSMGAKSFIVKGKGNLESFCSCSHGAGRKMSRTKAKKIFSEVDLAEQTKGVECRKDTEVVDEIPGAYKDIDEVMANQSDLVDVAYTLKQLICVKG